MNATIRRVLCGAGVCLVVVAAPVAAWASTPVVPYSVTQSTAYAGSVGASAFDGVLSSEWLTNGPIASQWLAIHLGTPAAVTSYSFYPHVLTRMPMSWTFQGSNDGGTTWATVDTRSGAAWTDATWQAFMFTNTVAYSDYRWAIGSAVAGNDGYVNIAEITLASSPPAGPGPGSGSSPYVALGSALVGGLFVGSVLLAVLLSIPSRP